MVLVVPLIFILSLIFLFIPFCCMSLMVLNAAIRLCHIFNFIVSYILYPVFLKLQHELLPLIDCCKAIGMIMAAMA